MRKITITFEVPEKYEQKYSDIDADVVFWDFFRSNWGYGVEVVSDSARNETPTEDMK